MFCIRGKAIQHQVFNRFALAAAKEHHQGKSEISRNSIGSNTRLLCGDLP